MSDDKSPFHNPFGALRGLKDRLPAGPASGSEPVRSPATHTKGKTYPRAVVRMERTGRGGKEVTVVEHLNLPPAERETWLRALKGALGCGGVIEGENLVLQGDHRKRLPDILSERGVKRVTTG
jgi:translation initiation factor 1